MLGYHRNVISTRESHAFPLVDQTVEGVGWDQPGIQDALKQSYRQQRKHRVGIHNYVSLPEFARIIDDAVRMAHRQPECDNARFSDQVVQEVFDRYFWSEGGTSADVFLEKSPCHSLFAERILRVFPDCKLLHVLRDGRDVCVSMQMRALKADWSPAQRSRQIEMWLSHVSAVNRVQEMPEFSGRVQTVRYEDLQQDTAMALKRLLRFVGLDHTSSLVDKMISKTSFKKKTKTGPGRHSYKGVVGEWRHHFSYDDIRLYTSKAREVHVSCGYPLETN
jgi:hypothetical protein